MPLDWLPMGAKVADTSPLTPYLRLLVGWNPTGKHGHERECDDYEVERWEPLTRTHEGIVTMLRERALANLGVWFCVQWWCDDAHRLTWLRYTAFEMCVTEPTDFLPDRSIRGAVGVMPSYKTVNAEKIKGRRKNKASEVKKDEWEKF